MSELFPEFPNTSSQDDIASADRPLADRLRPKTLEEVIGQQHIIGPEGTLKRMVGSGRLGSLILWGPPGTGKTTVARLLANETDYRFEQISAIFSGVADLKKVFEAARQARRAGKRTLLFVDEIHRFNRAQQDSFLPVMEDGTVVLVGATTENPSFELNGALMSRAQVLKFESLSRDDLASMATRAEQELGHPIPVDDDAREVLITLADGDGRAFLGLIEEVVSAIFDDEILTPETLTKFVQRRAPIYDKKQDGHYNLISALHKTVRGSDPDAALYYFARMVDAGEDPMYLARRLIRMAVEDVGIADPQALPIAIAAKDAYHMLGSPEGEMALAELVVYLATAPKSNAVHEAYNDAMAFVRRTGSPTPPMVILNAPTKMMKYQGYGDGYIYDHDTPEGFSGQEYFPPDIGRQSFYKPVERGFERDIQKRMDYFNKLRQRKKLDRGQ